MTRNPITQSPRVSRRSEQIDRAIVHLRRSDPVLRDVIRRVGPCRLPLRRDRFATLVRAIVGQQVSGHAARAIFARLQQAVVPEKLSATAIQGLTSDQLRAVGLSRQKASYLHDLCAKTSCGEVRLNQLGRLDDDRVIEELTKIKGIGRWTAEMLLIFSIGRLDVLPCDDLGIRNALQNLYELGASPDRPTCQQIAQPWRPYASVASWYCWRSLELSS